MKKKIKLAVVDDQLLFRKGFISLLKEFPEFDVVFDVSNGEELLDQLKTKKVDLVLLDLEMPKMDGFETTEQLQKAYKDLKIIILTTHNEESFIHHLISKGACGFILKDQDIETIVDAIYAVIETGYYFNDRVSRALVKGLIESKMVRPSFSMAYLSDREIEVIKLISKEATAKEISEKLHISIRTVEGHRERILQKIKAKNSVGIAMYAIKNNLLEF